MDTGVMNPQSQQIPILVRTSIGRQQAGMVGRGVNYHPNVHIDEGLPPASQKLSEYKVQLLTLTAADLYRVIIEASLSGQDIGHGREGYYFAENGEHTMYDIAERMGEELYGMGLARTATPSSFTREELQRYFHGVSCISKLCGPERLILSFTTVRQLGDECPLSGGEVQSNRLETQAHNTRHARQHQARDRVHRRWP